MRLSPFFLSALSLLTLAGQHISASDFPTVKAPAPAINVARDGQIAAIDLRNHFEVTDLASPIVQVQFNVGTVNLQMFPGNTPKTVANFLNYVNSGRYANSLLHRSVSNFVVQGGGYSLPNLEKITADAPVQNEYGISNLRGTVAMAKLGSDPNSATSEWFFNLGDNSANLDFQNGGFTVFARVAGTGMSVVDSIAALPVYDKSADFGSAFNQLPLQNYAEGSSVQLTNVVTLTKAAQVPVFPGTANEDAVVHYGGSISNPGLVTGLLEGSLLKLSLVAGQTGECDVTIAALDSQDNKAEVTFHVVVTAPNVVFDNPWDAIGLNKSWFGNFDGSKWPVIKHATLLQATVDAKSNSVNGYYLNFKKSKVKTLIAKQEYNGWYYGYSNSKDLPTGWMKVRLNKGKRSFYSFKKKKWIKDL